MYSSRPRRRAVALTLTLLTGLGTVGLSAPATAHDRGQQGRGTGYGVVATGLDNPRHLTFANGALYVAEAGEGGDGACFPSPEGQACYGATGAITRIKHGRQSRVVTGLPSLAGAEGGGASGPSDLHVRGRRYTVSIGLGADPRLRADQEAGIRKLATVSEGRFGSSRLRVVADIGEHEIQANPEPTDFDSNPVGLGASGRSLYVADAGGNSVHKINRRGQVRTIAVLPSIPVSGFTDADAVPTEVVKGPDGALYVSQLTGFPFAPGTASIWRIVPGEKPTRYATGLTMVTDMAFGRDGSLYAVQLADRGLAGGPPIGSVVRIPRGGGATHTTVRGGLFFPYGIALHGGSAYVTTHSASANEGQVERIPLHG